ncbi:acetyl-CoA synthetase [Brevibacterium sanguinis]|uniref:Acetyl-CoA synthetase n=2 Tax=Brevibacterium TaxID=1696 RepID=A0A366IM06_9MICO|nr:MULTISPECIES: AMP-binding protein [Brevibacterium]RBP67233.1 acetyl-CoA synthetase [Brevibacterium sanguinis]RBP73758.1 acetyl-CoA synthetase [Brevibacterium celere]
MTVTSDFRAARDRLIELRSDWAAARESFEWPRFTHFNFALDWFDEIARDNDAPALWIVEQDGSEGKWSFAELSERSNRVANFLRHAGVKRGDHVMVMLGNQVELWETMLAGIKLGAVLMPTTTQLGPIDLSDRVERGQAQFVVAGPADAAKFDEVDAEVVRIVVGGESSRDQDFDYADAGRESAEFDPQGKSRADDLLLLYFTSGTTSKAKMVAHSHVSYPVGHLSTMYWMGLAPGDVHLNVASPGWAKHAWSNIFTPWIAESCVFLYNYTRFDANALMETMDRVGVTSFCAPPTVWRMLIQADLGHLKNPPSKALGAGEPLNPEVIDQVRRVWGVHIRDGYGQTETTLQIGNSPDQEFKPGSMGRPLPGYDVVLIDPATGEEGDEGEICLRLDPRPIGLTSGYWSNEEKTAEAFSGGVYHTGDVAQRDADGFITYVGRADDVFKASDYRLSPFELESVLIEHEAVAEAAVVPSPDPARLAVPKAYVVVAGGYEPDADTARDILAYSREHLAPYKRIRRLEFAELPKTISGKIRRVELRAREDQLHPFSGEPQVEGREYADTDFDLRS